MSKRNFFSFPGFVILRRLRNVIHNSHQCSPPGTAWKSSRQQRASFHVAAIWSSAWTAQLGLRWLFHWHRISWRKVQIHRIPSPCPRGDSSSVVGTSSGRTARPNSSRRRWSKVRLTWPGGPRHPGPVVPPPYSHLQPPDPRRSRSSRCCCCSLRLLHLEFWKMFSRTFGVWQNFLVFRYILGMSSISPSITISQCAFPNIAWFFSVKVNFVL